MRYHCRKARIAAGNTQLEHFLVVSALHERDSHGCLKKNLLCDEEKFVFTCIVQETAMVAMKETARESWVPCRGGVPP